jgi:hypothetical protein
MGCSRHSYNSLAGGYASSAFNAPSMNTLSAGFNPPPAACPQIWPQFCVRHLRHFELIVADAKIKVGFARHDDRSNSRPTRRSARTIRWARGREFAVGFVGELCSRKGNPGLKHNVA